MKFEFIQRFEIDAHFQIGWNNFIDSSSIHGFKVSFHKLTYKNIKEKIYNGSDSNCWRF